MLRSRIATRLDRRLASRFASYVRPASRPASRGAKRRVTLLAAFVGSVGVAGLPLSAAHASPSVERPLTSAHRLSLSGAFSTSLSVGPKPKLVIEGPAEQVVVKADDDRIRISRTSGRGDEVKLTIVVAGLEDLSLSGAQDFRAADLRGERLALDFSGASHAVFAGDCGALSIDLSGASKLDASELRARSVDLEASGASKADLNASETLRIKASGASRIRYRGEAKVETKTSGAASIRRI